jgi:protein-disulfide isomerase
MKAHHPHHPFGRFVLRGLLTLAVVFGGWMAIACSADADDAAATTETDGAQVLATVQGDEITMAEVEAEATEELEQAEMQLLQCESSYKQRRHEVLETKVRQMVQDSLLEAKATERGMTKEELIATEVESKVAEVTDADVDAFYTENQARIGNRPKEQIAPQIRDYLAQQRETEAYQSFIDALESEAEVSYDIEPYRVDVASADAPSHGPANAPVTIVEFSDFECPFCSRVVPTLDQVKENYGDKVRIVFRQFPLAMHPNAQKAAEASLCADDQDKFWQMHDLMFEEQQSLAVADLKDKASRLELDTAAFNECLDSGTYADQVAADMRDGSVAGVSGTPAMFINGRMVSGAVPYEQVAEVIDEELERTGASR